MASRTAFSTSYQDVNATINGGTDSNGHAWTACSSGDVINIPSGNSLTTWNQSLVISVPITLQGQSTVTGGYADWLAALPATPTTARNTIIQDAIPSGTPTSGGAQNLIRINTGDPFNLTRITGLAFLQNGTHPNWSSGVISPKYNSLFRVDHCEFDGLLNELVWAYSEKGVIDHCVALNMREIFFHHKPINWGGYTANQLGDGSWAAALDLGGDNAVYVEDCFVKPTGTRGTADGESGGRYTIRYCILYSTSVQNHGAEASWSRSGRKIEVYKNTFILESGKIKPQITFWRGGSGMIWGNTATGNYQTTATFVNYRDNRNASWGDSNGLNDWDQNDPHGVWFTGTAASASTTSATVSSVVITGASWTTDQWTHYSLMNSGTGLCAPISGNTSNTLQFLPSDTVPYDLKFNSGDTAEIRRVFHSVDHCGAGVSDNLALLSITQRHTPQNMHQAREPVYIWDNTINSVLSGGKTQYNIVENLDFYNETLTFDGTTGMGKGLRSARPATCTPGTDPLTGAPIKGVGYWATDEQKLYVATAPDTWTLYYQPLVYPHPLVEAPTGSFISLSGNLDFGNVITGQTAQLGFVIGNSGTDDLAVSSITYPSGLTGAYSGTIPAGEKHDVTVTFSPLLVQDYSGTITVNSDADAGVNTIAVTGIGTAPAVVSSPYSERSKDLARRVGVIGRGI